MRPSKEPILFDGRSHKNCDPMCDECREWMDGFGDQFRPIVREIVDEIYTFLERRIAGYKRDGDPEQDDLIDVIADCLTYSVAEKIPPSGLGWPELRRQVWARRVSHQARERRNGN